MKKISINFVLVIIVLLTSSCGSSALTVKQEAIATTPAFSVIEQPQPTGPSFSMPTMMPTIEATLDATGTKETLTKYLENSGSYSSPCFLSIYPGKTTVSEMKEILTHIGLPLWISVNKNEEFYEVNYEFDNDLSLNGVFIVQDQLVKNIKIGIGLETVEARDVRNWSAFSPETLIDRYGMPSEVTIALDWGPSSLFEMNVYFKTVDLIVQYVGYDFLPVRSKSMIFCPFVAPIEYIRIWMGKDPQYPPLEAVSFEKATLLTMEEFSKLMTGNPDQACFIINGEVFP
jgi:hypothetical protein